MGRILKRALLVNWDSFPNFAAGGVYTWEKTLIENMPDWRFVVFNQLSNPNALGKYSLPKNVESVIAFPIFGTLRFEEFQRNQGSIVPRIVRTTSSVIEKEFLPLFREFLNQVLSDTCDTQRIQWSVLKLYNFLAKHDSKKCFEDYRTWGMFLERIKSDPLYREMYLREVHTAFQLIHRGLQILAVEIPRVDIIHSSLAWMPSLIAIPAKIMNKTPFIVTEHGVAFRELLLYYNAYLLNEPAKIFWKVFARNIVRSIYAAADVIVPVCEANVTWERSIGADPSKIKVIYNGVNVSRFKPMIVKKETTRPIVVSIARVDVFKDIIGLIQAIGHVKESLQNILCLLYGGATDLEYSIKCLDIVRDFRLENNFKFMGPTNEPEKAYAIGDVVGFSSVSEAFPFTVLEAMACGKAIVASDVGGVSEALGGCGILVRSRQPRDLAKGIIELLQNERLRNSLELASLNRARELFSIEKSVSQYKLLYASLSRPNERNYVETGPVPNDVVIAR